MARTGRIARRCCTTDLTWETWSRPEAEEQQHRFSRFPASISSSQPNPPALLSPTRPPQPRGTSSLALSCSLACWQVKVEACTRMYDRIVLTSMHGPRLLDDGLCARAARYFPEVHWGRGWKACWLDVAGCRLQSTPLVYLPVAL